MCCKIEQGRRGSSDKCPYTMGKEAEHVFKAFTFVEGDEKKYAKVIEKFEDHFVPKKNYSIPVRRRLQYTFRLAIFFRFGFFG